MFTMNVNLTEGRCRNLKHLLLLSLFLSIGSVHSAIAQQRIPLSDALRQIEQRFQANLSYEHNLLNGKSTSMQAMRGEKLEEVLKQVLYPNQLIFLYVDERSYSIVKRNASFFSNQQPTAPGSGPTEQAMEPRMERLTGVVMEASTKEIPFASLWVKGTRIGAKADEKGRFSLYNIQPTDTVVITALGYRQQAVPVEGRNTLTITMTQDKTELEEVVISTGYQKLSKERSTGSAAVITAKELEKIPSPNILQRLEGQIPGVQLMLNSGDRGFTYNNNQMALSSSTRTVGRTDYDINIRGVGTYSGEKMPLVVIDGAISNLDLSVLNPNDIESITFLKDAAAASIYGVRAANGVIVVNTKRGQLTGVPRINFSASTMFSGQPTLNYLKMMSSAELIDYQEELVAKGLLNNNNVSATTYNDATYYPGVVAEAAIRLKNGELTQQEYNALVNPVRSLNNRGQVEQYFLQPATNQQYNFSVSNGSEQNSYFYSASYSKERPYDTGVQGQRLTLNMNNSWKLFKIATLSTSVKGTFFKYQNNGLGLSSLYTGNQGSLLPYQLLVDEQGNGISYDRLNPAFTGTLGPVYKDWTYNYLQEQALMDNTQKSNNYVATINLEVPLYKGLKASVMYSNERNFSDTRRYYDESSYYYRDLLNRFTPIGGTANNLGLNTGGIYELINTNQNNYTLRGQLSYDAFWNEKHELTALAGSEIRQTELSQGSQSLYGYNRQTGFSTPMDYTATGYTDIQGYLTGISGAPVQGDRRRRFLSYFANAAYTYLGKYTISGSVRYDDYNNFGLDRQYRATPLWSGGLKWNAKKESFLQNLHWLSQLSLRTSYGVNGNISQDASPFTYIALSDGSWNGNTNLPYASIIALANPALRWEKTYVTNIGLDFGLFNHRLSGTVDYYQKRGRDLLYSFPIAAAYAGTIGNGMLERNTASMDGKGIDLGINGVLLQNSDWLVELMANFSYNTNKITDNRFRSQDVSINTLSYSPTGIGYLKGYPSDKVLVFRHAGLDEKGMTQVYNKNNEIISVSQSLSDLEDLKYAGRRTAPYYGSLRPNISYKQFSIFALVTYQFGSVFMRPSMEGYITPSRWGTNTPAYDLSAAIADRWRKPGDEAFTNVPALTADTYGSYSVQRYLNSDINVLKGDYIRLREISLSYRLPRSILEKLRVEQVSLTGSVRNIGFIWRANKEGYDPDFVATVGNLSNLPPVTSYNFSLNVNF